MASTSAIGGPFDCYPPSWPTYPPFYPTAEPSRVTTGEHRTVSIVPSIQEQMGTDPISKLAAAIEKLADALKEEKDRA